MKNTFINTLIFLISILVLGIFLAPFIKSIEGFKSNYFASLRRTEGIYPVSVDQAILDDYPLIGIYIKAYNSIIHYNNETNTIVTTDIVDNQLNNIVDNNEIILNSSRKLYAMYEYFLNYIFQPLSMNILYNEI